MVSRSGAQPRIRKHVLCQVGLMYSLEQDNAYVLSQVGLMHSLEKENITVLCQISLEAFDSVQWHTVRCGVEKSGWRVGGT